jgi:lysyl-tRNA synthetase class 2
MADEPTDQTRVRTEKLQALREMGRDPFAIERFERTHSISQLLAEDADGDAKDYRGKLLPPLVHAGKETAIAGRLTAVRKMGKAFFFDLQDQSGQIQLYLKKDNVSEELFRVAGLLDVGDIVGSEGEVFRTSTGEPSVDVRDLSLLSKSLRPLPLGKERDGEKFVQLRDTDLRYRQRYADLAANPKVRKTFEARSLAIKKIREFYDSRGFIEVETPVLQDVAGGAAARPFTTHHNALNTDFRLRIALELYLKRLLVGGFEKVYEIGRVFRNEGLSTRHNPEYTLLESYEAYIDLDDLMSFVEELIAEVAVALNGRAIGLHDGAEIDLARPWVRLSLFEAIEQHAGVSREALGSLDSAQKAAESLEIETQKGDTVGGIIEKIVEKFVEPKLMEPTYLIDFPLEISPLAKKKKDDPGLVRRFELIISGQEIAPGYSEINDPLDQRERFEAQMEMRRKGDEEAHPMDEDFLRAMEYGMPPCAGVGIGVDRLVMILTGAKAIRDVILFPQLRPEGSS